MLHFSSRWTLMKRKAFSLHLAECNDILKARPFVYNLRSNSNSILLLALRHVCYNALWKITHFEKFFQSALNLGPSQRTLKKKIFFQSALISAILTHFEKKEDNLGNFRNLSSYFDLFFRMYWTTNVTYSRCS